MSSRIAKHSHYVSNSNNSIYPAMTSPDGYEDAHPDEWRPATAAEAQKYEDGETTVTLKELTLGAASGASQPVTPSTLTLQPETETAAAAQTDTGLPPPPPAPVPAFSIPE